ncbi:alanyl-tRNA editing protein [Mesosutterella sp. AGMB02718]|uniref:Alanine--tRNA ligase n=1 Tax=Mesosutterella faecium TaxID=2925194 RepID=A0ABT7IP19_9BURK|nr:alanyl-tRNA editing protein [Mesosutterella sp. AGMB02718]MDL2059700.1 alanyl-tRNA editing protein [Mesosutterella sp. AGMB02718]
MESMNELFYRDPYCRSFSAEVVSCTEGSKGYEIVLNDTAFYPEGGGQPADHGKIGEAVINDVRRNGDVIIHFADRPLTPGMTVKAELDWPRRFDNMQNHTGEHMFSGLVHRRFKYDNVGFHMDEDVITVDFNGPIGEEDLRQLEKETNEAIAAGISVQTLFPSPEALSQMDYRSKKELKGKVRIVDIPGVDRCACCGTHVKNTSEVGIFKILGAMKHRGGTRVEFVCGARALRDYTLKVEQARQVSQLLSVKPNATAAGVVKVLKEVQERDERIAALNERYFRLRAETLQADGPLLVDVEEGLSPLECRKFCGLLAESFKSGAVAVLSPSGPQSEGPAFNYVIHSGDPELRNVSKTLNQRLNGRGGGSGGFVQGSYRASEQAIRAALSEAFKAS